MESVSDNEECTDEDDPARRPAEVVADLGHAGERLDRFLAGQFPALSRSRLKTLIEKGRVRADGNIVSDAAGKVRTGTVYRVDVPRPEPSRFLPEPIPLNILHEDAHLLVLDKQAGLAVHPAPGAWTGTLAHGLLHHCGAALMEIGAAGRPGIVHRLDKDTTGVLVVAKSETALHSLGKQFQAKSAERIYRALSVGAPSPVLGRVETRIGRDPRDRKKMAVLPETSNAGKLAATHYQTVAMLGAGPRGAAAAELRLILETGRTHQIRVHMAHLSCPLIGDETYGGSRAARALDLSLAEQGIAMKRQALHAAVLGFRHPFTNEMMRFETSPPDDWQSLRAALMNIRVK